MNDTLCQLLAYILLEKWKLLHLFENTRTANTIIAMNIDQISSHLASINARAYGTSNSEN